MRVKNSNIYQIKSSPHMWHLGTVIDGMHEYVALVCLVGPKQGNVYIEELVATSIDFTSDTFGHLKFIDNELQAREVHLFFKEKGLLEIQERLEHMVWAGMLAEQGTVEAEEAKKLAETLNVPWTP